MTSKSRPADFSLVLLLLCVGIAVIVPGCNAACDFPDVDHCLPGFLGSNADGINDFRCSQDNRTCIHNLRDSCPTSHLHKAMGQFADLTDYVCSTQGLTDLNAYLTCTSAASSAVTNQYSMDMLPCLAIMIGVGQNPTQSQMCSGARDFRACLESAFNIMCTDAASRRFYSKYASISEIGACFAEAGVAENIPFISKLSMAVWAGLLTIFLQFK